MLLHIPKNQALEDIHSQKSFEKLIQANKLMIHKIGRLGGSSGQRQDLFQDIVYQLWSVYPKFRGESKAAPGCTESV